MMRDDQFFAKLRPIVGMLRSASRSTEGQGASAGGFHHSIDVLLWAGPSMRGLVSNFERHIAELVQAHPRHYVGLATVPIQDTDVAIEVLEAADKTWAFKSAPTSTAPGQDSCL